MEHFKFLQLQKGSEDREWLAVFSSAKPIAQHAGRPEIKSMHRNVNLSRAG